MNISGGIKICTKKDSKYEKVKHTKKLIKIQHHNIRMYKQYTIRLPYLTPPPNMIIEKHEMREI